MRSARASGWRRQVAIASAPPARMPACGPPSSLSPEKQTRSQPSRSASRASGSPASSSASSSAPEPTSKTSGRPAAVGDLRELAHADLAREAEHPVVGGVDAEDGARRGAERARVVGGARAVGRAHLAQPRARALDDLGDAEPVADLDELAARDDDLAPARERRERQHQRGGAVVDADRGLGARQLADERGDVILARAAAARSRGRARGSSTPRRRPARARARLRPAGPGRGWCAGRRRWR